MKKFMSMLLAAMLVFSMAGCGEKKGKENNQKGNVSAESVLDEAMKKQAELDSWDSKMNMSMDMDIDGEAFAADMEMDIQIQDINKESMKMAMLMSMDMSDYGMSLDMDMYYADGYYYMDMLGMKMKTAMNLDEMQESMIDTSGMTDIDVDELQELTLKENGNGYTIDFVGDAENMTDLTNAVMENMGSTTGLGEFDFTLDKITGSTDINEDGYLTKMVMLMDMTMEMDGQSYVANIELEMTYNNPGKAVTVELPDLSEYEETDLMGY